MDEEIDRAVRILTGKIVQTVKPDEALKLTQAVLNLVNVKLVLYGETKDRRMKGAGA